MRRLSRKRWFASLAAGLLALPLATALASTNALAAGEKEQAPRDTAKYEAWLTKEVRHELVMLPWYSLFDNLEYKVEGNKVILTGQVVRPSLKDDAARAVKSIEGVEAVDNRIEVLPLSAMDDQLRGAEFRAIYGQPSLQRYAQGAVPPIHIIVKNGHVTLEGAVATAADKNVAGIQANSVPNVFSVTNNLRVDSGS
jgi:hyperosmotically inducible periplasmic protein